MNIEIRKSVNVFFDSMILITAEVKRTDFLYVNILFILCFTCINSYSDSLLSTNKTGDVSAENVQYAGENIFDQSGKVMTVLGAIDTEELGQTLMHEHLFFQFMPPLDQHNRWEKLKSVRGYKKPESNAEIKTWKELVTTRNTQKMRRQMSQDMFTLNSISDAVEEVLAYKELGGRTIVDVTPDPLLGRQPDKLRELSRKTGVNIVMATGFYEAFTHPEDMDQRTVDDLTDYMVREITEGVGDTGIKAGIIGELSTTNIKFSPESNDVRVLRAAARASQLTGVAISLHNMIIPSKNNLHVALDILEEEGADLARVIVGHIPGLLPPAGVSPPASTGFLESLLRRGVYLQFDTLGASYKQRGHQTNDFQVDLLVELIKRGYSDRLLVSHDIYSKSHLTKNGGYGLTFIHGYLVPYLLKNGIYRYQINNILIENPKKVLGLVQPQRI